MKNVIRSSTTALLALGFASLASALPGPVVPGFTAKLTLALKQSETVGGFKDGEALETTTKGSVTTEVVKTKIDTTRYGVKELLEDLEEDGTISGSIEGWSIVGVTTLGSATPLLYAVKDTQKILLDSLFFADTASAEKESSTSVVDSAEDTSEKTGSYSTKAAVNFTLLTTKLYGIATGSASWKKRTLAGEDYVVEVPGTYNLAGISGGINVPVDEIVIEGSAKLSGAKFEDVASFDSPLNLP